MSRRTGSWVPWIFLLVGSYILSPATLFSQELQLPTDYSIDLQLAEAGRSRIMAGSTETNGTVANEIGDEVFHRLISAGFDQPFPWKMTLVNNSVVNATSTAAGKVYVHGGLVPLLGQDKGMWAAVLSHEIAHTGRRHQVRVYMQEVYNQRMIAYYRARVAAGDKNANWSLIGFATASRIALKKLERDQEHDADQQGMLLMAKAGFHPDYVFALHHLLLMRTGEQSRFSAFFSDHPRWETRDQRSDKVYGDALAEFNHDWPDPASSPGGPAPLVAFVGQPEAKENKKTASADVSIPVYCRNSDRPVDLVLAFEKDNHPVKATDSEFSDKDGNLAFHERTDCLEKNETTPVLLHVPANALSAHDRSLKAKAYVESEGNLIACSKPFDIHFPVAKGANGIHEVRSHSQPVDHIESVTLTQSSSPTVAREAATAPSLVGTSQEKGIPANNEREGSLSITASNAGAEIFVDSTGRGKAPTSFKLKAGTHSVQVVLGGYQDWVQEVSVEVGKTTVVTADLRPVATVQVETPSLHASSHMPNDEAMKSDPDSSAIAVRQERASSEQKIDIKKASVVNSSPLNSSGWVGITGITGAYGIIITDLAPEGPGMKAGLKIADTIIGVDDKSVRTTQMMDSVTNPLAEGSKIKVSFIRNGIAEETIVTVRNPH